MTRGDLLDADQLSQVLATTSRDLFRMETLPAYDVPINGNDLQRWLAGEPEPTWGNKQPWLDMGAHVLGSQHVRRHCQAADAAWRLAMRFGSWWAAHPQHHHPARVAS